MKKTVSLILAIILIFGFSGGQVVYALNPQVTGGTNFDSATLLTDQSSYLQLIPEMYFIFDEMMGSYEMWANNYPYFKFIPSESGVYTLTVTGSGESNGSTFEFQVKDKESNSYLDYDSITMNYNTSNQRQITVQAGVAYYIYVYRSTAQNTFYNVVFDKPLQSTEGVIEPSILTIDPVDGITMNSLEGSFPIVTVRDENGEIVIGKTVQYTCESLSEYGASISNLDRYISISENTPNGTYTVTVSLSDNSAEPITFDIELNIIVPASPTSIVLSAQYTELVKDGTEDTFSVKFPTTAVYDSEGQLMVDAECEIVAGDFEDLNSYIIDVEETETGFQLSKEIPLGIYRLTYGLSGEGSSELTSDYEIIVRNPRIEYTTTTGGAITGDTIQTVEPGTNGIEVTAVPNVGYVFSKWSDGVTTVDRIDENVTGDISVTAEFIATDSIAPRLAVGTVSRTSDAEGTVKFITDEAGSYYYAVVSDGAGEPVIDTSSAGTACITAEITITNPTGLTAGAKDIYIKVKDAVGNVSTALKIDIPAYVASGGGSSSGRYSSGSSSGGTATLPSQDFVVVVVNGKEQDAGKETKTTEDGKSAVTVEVDNKVIESKIDEAIKNNTTDDENTIQVPVEDSKSDIAKVALTGDIVKKLEENRFDVSVKRDNVEYVIPAEEFTISKVAENLGVSETNLKDIKVEVKITKLDDKVVEKYKEVAKTNNAELVFSPMSFEVVAKTTKADGTTGEVGINKFSNYVERVLEIPDGVDPSKITTGIVFNSDGTYSHVPTEVFKKEGKWYAKLNSLTNSNYSIVWNSVTVKSVENHWAKDAVNDLASRLVIFNPEGFVPDKAITRADYAEYIIRALGLYREGSTHVNKFKDVTASSHRTLAILVASEYGIVTGYTDGTFKPDTLITREEAMAMYQRAMKVTKLVGNDMNRYQSYTDFGKVSSWASTSVKDVLAAHIFNGTSSTTISPKSSLTYAEAAQAIKNLLVESKLINK